MTVDELIVELDNYNDDTLVQIHVSEGDIRKVGKIQLCKEPGKGGNFHLVIEARK